MYQRRLFWLLLLPSLLSGFLVTALSVSYLTYAGWQYIQDNQYFYDFLFGAYGAQTYLWEHPFSWPAWLTHAFGGSLAYFVSIVAVALIAGTIVYGVLQIISTIRTQKSDFSQELAITAGKQRDDMIAEAITRMALRVMALLGWGLYALFFTNTLLEAVTVALHLGIDNIQAKHIALGVLQLGGDTLLLAVATHVHVYFLRLALLRPRALHGDQSIEAVEVESQHRSMAPL